MADLSITINPSPVISVGIGPPQSTSVTIGNGVTPHNTSHSPAGLDSLVTWYATVGDLNSLSGLLPSGIVYTSGNQNISGAKNFFSRPTVNGSGVMLSGEIAGTGYLTGYVQTSQTGQFVSTGSTGNFVTSGNTGNFVTSTQTGLLTGTFYPYSANPASYVQGAVVRPSNTGNFVDTNSAQTISGNKYFSGDVNAGLNNQSTVFPPGRFNTIMGGTGNVANGYYNFVGGGQNSTVSGGWCVSLGGVSSYVSGNSAAIIGQANRAIGDFSITLGSNNSSTGFAASILAGRSNRVSGDYSTTLGSDSRVIGSRSFSIGNYNDVSGANSFAIGRYAYADDPSAGIISVSENIVRSSGSGTLVINFDSGIYLNGPTIFNNRPTLNGTGFLLSGEAPRLATGASFIENATTGDLNSIVILLNALKATAISHGLMNAS